MFRKNLFRTNFSSKVHNLRVFSINSIFQTAGINSEKGFRTHRIQHGDHADVELRLRHLDTIKRTRKNDTIDSTQNASLHRQDKKGSSSNTDYDQDSDVSFMKDTDEDIDTGEIEEEDWIEYLKKEQPELLKSWKQPKIPCWIETHRRMKWRLQNGTLGLASNTRHTDHWEDQEREKKTKWMNFSSQSKLNR